MYKSILKKNLSNASLVKDLTLVCRTEGDRDHCFGAHYKLQRLMSTD